jgi:hypothetical protein
MTHFSILECNHDFCFVCADDGICSEQNDRIDENDGPGKFQSFQLQHSKRIEH